MRSLLEREAKKRGISFDAKERHSKYVPHVPHPKQQRFISYEGDETLFGGAAGGGKSDAALMLALEGVETKPIQSLILRRTYKELALPGGLIPRSHSWLARTDAHWDGELKEWRFPSGASVTFGYLEGAYDHLRYQSSEFHRIHFEELTQWPTDVQYRYLFSRIRRLEGSGMPLRMTASTNPGGPGHEWVKARFCPKPGDVWDGETFEQTVRIEDFDDPIVRAFIPSRIEDNPSIDRREYTRALSHLDPVTREQLLRGDWSISPTGMFFTSAMFEDCWYDDPPPNLTMKASGWDTAITQTGDWNARAFGYIWGRCLYLDDVRRFHADTPEIKAQIQAHAYSDGLCPVGIEQAVGSLSIIQDLKLEPAMRKVALWPVPIKGKTKLDRAQGWRSKLIAGDLKLRRGPWNDAFVEECLRFTNDTDVDTDDQIDAVTVWFETIYKFFGTQDVPGVPPAPGTEAFYEMQRKEREPLEESDYGH